MIFRYSRKDNRLFLEQTPLSLIDNEMNEIGACIKCLGRLESVSSYRLLNDNENNEPEYTVVSKCDSCFSFYVDLYDSNWTWIHEVEPVVFENSIPDEINDSDKIQKPNTEKDFPDQKSISDGSDLLAGGIDLSADVMGFSDQKIILSGPEPSKTKSKAKIKTKTNRKYKIPVYSDIIESADDLRQIPDVQLKSVFSKAEIDAMMAKADGKKPVRQYFHRAKKKYKLFEEIFGIKIDID
ncbi:hypothetical protein [Methanolapillus ohkumae]|uniref:Uncharacterized protein n=1 Tax=Methanolapillus ohkumae TaxID=3028298 RepID=A0AA96V5H9_9EURY|nr:hypothetical protein MsAm2_08270 [Methanosarcinaceae archaeon Am2]